MASQGERLSLAKCTELEGRREAANDENEADLDRHPFFFRKRILLLLNEQGALAEFSVVQWPVIVNMAIATCVTLSKRRKTEKY
jgi:hypothetical protein